ncbi:hypothetical protein SEA_MIDAS2_58 [Mycobacterium phage Midas2]|nr:hypothetical protein SEA_MIDAS2_58 [Mycobacterium phage Midas2]
MVRRYDDVTNTLIAVVAIALIIAGVGYLGWLFDD